MNPKMIRVHEVCLVLFCLMIWSLIHPSLAIAASKAPSLLMENTSAEPDQNVTVDVKIVDNPGIIGATLEITYDSRLTLTSIQNGTAFQMLDMTKPKDYLSGCRVHWDAIDINADEVRDGTVMTLTFSVAAGVAAGTQCPVSVAAAISGTRPDVYDSSMNVVKLQSAACDVTIGSVEDFPIDISGANVEVVGAPFIYTGIAIEPAVIVTMPNAVLAGEFGLFAQTDGQTLNPATDYTLAYTGNVDAGNATVIVSGRGDYTGIATGHFVIDKAIDPAVIASSASVRRGGTMLDLSTLVANAAGEVTFSILRATHGASLTRDGRFTSGNEVASIDVGVTVAESTNHLGRTETMEISVIDKATASLSVIQEGTSFGAELASPTYDNPIAGGVETLCYEGTTVRGVAFGPGTNAPTDAGRYTVAVTYETQDTIYSGYASFDISPAEIADASVEAIPDQAWTGSPITVEPRISLGGSTLVSDLDYSVSYFNNVDPGTAIVEIEGIGNYAGTATATFEIVASPADSSDMYRLYNPNSGEHFYTADEAERDGLERVGWRYEGVGWVAPAEGDPVFRLYNPNAGDHHYTTDEGERDSLVRVGWRYEGIGWMSAGEGGIALHRLYNPNAVAGSHHYTTNEGERDFLVSLGWRYEGVGWYGLA